ncbi:hypothetical protein [Nocardia aurantia]|uniref:Uncharacterized protein n=1 Tax=Nocardia aurantia TaxID=2585199 RepID=A0A7K0DXT6_9NOCA|nr:hypothetical protein [Nocardia aurantia]MQY30368.1 hypothetical protein [Nocardia aurantia]
MTEQATYTLSATSVTLTYATETGELRLELGDAYSPFDGTHELLSAPEDLPPGAGIRLTGTVRHESVGRGGPLVRTARVTVFLPDAPAPGAEVAEPAATGALVFADPGARGETAPSFGAVTLTGRITVPAAIAGGRF